MEETVTTSRDFEASPRWLEDLQQLNAVVAATGEPLAGNLFYDHLAEDFLGRSPDDILRPKRDRFRYALRSARRLLEIGVNGGHSAFLALSSNPSLSVVGVDICEHAYAVPASEWLRDRFPGRFTLVQGDCLTEVPALATAGEAFDSFHVDGAKDTYWHDIVNCQRLVDGAAARIVVDDVQIEYVGEVWNRAVRQRRIDVDADFPSMPTEVGYRNEIGMLRAHSARDRLLRRVRSVLPSRRA